MKKFLQGLLGVAMSATVLAPISTSAASYPDVSTSHWAYNYVSSASKNGFMSGKTTGLFAPEDTITIGEFAVVVMNGFFDGQKTVKSNDNHWADPYLNTLYDNGVLVSNGGDNIMNMSSSGWEDVPLTREDAASIIARLMSKKGFPSGSNGVRYRYTDLTNGALSSSAAGQVVQSTANQIQDISDCIENEMMTGSNGVFGIGQSMSRAEAAVVFNAMTMKGLLSSSSSSGTTVTNPSTGATTTTPNTGSTTTPSTPTTPSTSTNPNANVPAPSNVVLGSGQYNTNTYTVAADTNKDGWLTYTEVEAVLTQLQKEYPADSPWGNDKYYKATVSPTGKVTNAYGCAAFALMVSDRVFGDLPYRRVSADLTIDVKQVFRPADIVHSTAINHWQVNMGEYWEGNGAYRYSAGGNENGMVSWGAVGSYSGALESLIKYDGVVMFCYTRYPV